MTSCMWVNPEDSSKSQNHRMNPRPTRVVTSEFLPTRIASDNNTCQAYVTGNDRETTNNRIQPIPFGLDGQARAAWSFPSDFRITKG